MEKKHIVGILIGEAPSLEKAKSVVENGSRCPYSVTYVNSGRTIIGVSRYTTGPQMVAGMGRRTP